MKNFIKFTLALLLSLTLFSCSNDDSSSEKKYLLEKFISSADGLQLKIVYNDKNLITEFQNYGSGTIQSVSYFTYVNNKLDRITYTNGYDKFIHNADGKLQKRETYDVGANTVETLNYSYEYLYENNKITSIYRDEFNTSISKREYLYNDSGNVIEERYYTINAANPNGVYQNSTFYSNYDDKKNVLSSLPADVLNGNTSKNNAKTISSSSNSTPSNYIFEYNEAGYVINRIDVGSTNTYQYEYLIK